MGLTHSIDKKIYETALARAGLSQQNLAESLGETPQNLSRWVNQGYPAAKVRDLARMLNIKPGDDFRRLIGAPVYRTFFRKKYNGQPSESVAKRAVELARFWFRWEYLQLDAAPFPNLSGEASPVTVAGAIRGIFKLAEFGVTFEPLRLSLINCGGVVAVPLSFSFFGLKDEDGKDNKECAVTVFDGVSKYVTLLDTDVNSSLLTFNLCHELSHIFRPDADQGRDEEVFCNRVASEIMYPDRIVREILARTEALSSVERLHAIHSKIGGSHLGITVALRERKLVKPSDAGRLYAVARSLEQDTAEFKPLARDLPTLKAFFDRLDAMDFRTVPYTDFRMAAIDGHLSGRLLADYLGIGSHDGILIADSWKDAATNENQG
jgi:hypothetical protein